MNELKPCPFCGGEAKTAQYDEVTWIIYCNVCDAKMEDYLSEGEAIEAWNRRVSE